MIVVLSGGVGGGRFCRGLVRAVPPEDVTIIGNTGDDLEIYGVHVSPDLDLVTFTLADVLDEDHGYGIAGDTRHMLSELAALGTDTWFDLGDRDLAICAQRTRWLDAGIPLSEVTARIARRFGLTVRILPMTDGPVWTAIDTDAGTMHFQDYWVRYRAEVPVHGVGFVGIADARPAPGVLQAIAGADVIIIAPSNPVVSIGPILAVPGIRAAIVAASAPVIGVSPIVGGHVVRGMADRLLPAIGVEVSAEGVAAHYATLLDGFVIDEQDATSESTVRALAGRCAVTDTIMRTPEDAERVARTALALAGTRR